MITIKGDPVHLGTHLGSGQSGAEVWKVTSESAPAPNSVLNILTLARCLSDRYPGCNYEIVAKMFHGDDILESDDIDDEIDAVHDVGDFCAEGTDGPGNKWMLMRWHDGVEVTHSSAYHGLKTYQECETFVTQLRRNVVGRMEDVFAHHERWHPYVTPAPCPPPSPF